MIDSILKAAREGGVAAMVASIALAVEAADTANKRERLAANLKANAENIEKEVGSYNDPPMDFGELKADPVT